jgi:hypothetical protein
MSYRVLFEGILARLKRRRWGTSVKQPNGPSVDTGVQAFADEIVIALSSDAPIELNRPIRIRRNYVGPVFIILDDDAEAINYLAADGTQTIQPAPLTKYVRVFDSVTISETKSAVRS